MFLRSVIEMLSKTHTKNTSNFRGSTMPGGSLVIAITLSDWLKLCQKMMSIVFLLYVLWLMALSVFCGVPETLGICLWLTDGHLNTFLSMTDVSAKRQHFPPKEERVGLQPPNCSIYLYKCMHISTAKNTAHGHEVKLVYSLSAQRRYRYQIPVVLAQVFCVLFKPWPVISYTSLSPVML